ncbi:RNA polymerase sigma-70 factor, ECF subfamily [Andreprevotia lacus DSM 23236]|uniref:RNA polymerase sigma-70 factor, ECF subfamily n=1 Tax=Andreprevotia lacus DSM 23236 TaxID=1121001 RepID=A0A1W1XAQ4_9NEIS|nr:RNA polymerase sigma factor SigJ [Andreprevotia lacus]SMC20864.1 RNA polymerase sigma-70 factor, ECF subfamily [Andreprevotia lacus DSM 23236]
MNLPRDPFDLHRARLFGLAYRMLGTRADAEDVVQDAYLRWHDASQHAVATPEAWLVTVTTRLAIDRLRVLKRERSSYVGPWLPDPLLTETLADCAPSPEWALELRGDVGLAFMTVLERLGPEERAAFLLREVLDCDYDEIATILGKKLPAVRQLVSRARKRLDDATPRHTVERATHIRLLDAFADAALRGDHAALQALFTDDVVLTSDGGGKVYATLRPLHGAERLARLYRAVAANRTGTAHYRHAQINGEPALLRYLDGRIDSAIVFVIRDERIAAMYNVRNPDKLAALQGA